MEAPVTPFFRQLARRFPLPDRYLVLDVETTGGGRDDQIVQVGYALAAGGRVECELSAVVDLPAGGWRPGWVADRLSLCRSRIELDEGGRPTGDVYPFTVDRLREQGVPPGPLFAQLAELFADCRAQRVPFVVHSGMTLDVRMWESAFGQIGRHWEFGPDELWDTGAIEKASRTQALPAPGERLVPYLRRAMFARKNGAGSVKYALGECARRYGLVARHGLDPLSGRVCDALVDARLTFHLFELYRAWADGRPGP